MHCHVLRGHCIAIELHHHTDTGAVQIGGYFRIRCKTLEAAESHVLADFSDQTFADIFQGRAKAVLAKGQVRQRGQVCRIVLGHQMGRSIGQGQEAVVLGDEIGLAIYFDHGASLRLARDRNHALCSDTGSRLTSFATQFHTQ